MARSRPCRICRRWFQAHPRVGSRQRTCSRPECQRERHRRSCACWHERNPDYDRETRLRVRLAQHRPETAASGLLPWTPARDAVGLQVLVVLEEVVRLLVSTLRDAVVRQLRVSKGESRRVPAALCETLSTNRPRPP